MQCPGTPEGKLTRNPGGFSPDLISGLPTSNEIETMFAMDADYDTPPYDLTSNMSFRNMFEGFANPNDGSYSKKMFFVV